MWFVVIRTAFELSFRLSAAHIRSVNMDIRDAADGFTKPLDKLLFLPWRSVMVE